MIFLKVPTIWVRHLREVRMGLYVVGVSPFRFAASLVLLLATFGASRANAADRPSEDTVNRALRDLVAHDGKGSVEVVGFKKLDGYPMAADGFGGPPGYVIEFEATLQAKKDGCLAVSLVRNGGMPAYAYFLESLDRMGATDSCMIAGNVFGKIVKKGHKQLDRGRFEFIRTENGWRRR